jgi:transcriptional regulator with XRE-family HTH domain
MSSISANLIKNRMRLKLSQEEFSRMIGVSQSTYQEWEKGRSPKIDWLPKLRDLFNLNCIDELFNNPNTLPEKNVDSP